MEANQHWGASTPVIRRPGNSAWRRDPDFTLAPFTSEFRFTLVGEGNKRREKWKTLAKVSKRLIVA